MRFVNSFFGHPAVLLLCFIAVVFGGMFGLFTGMDYLMDCKEVSPTVYSRLETNHKSNSPEVRRMIREAIDDECITRREYKAIEAKIEREEKHALRLQLQE